MKRNILLIVSIFAFLMVLSPFIYKVVASTVEEYTIQSIGHYKGSTRTIILNRSGVLGPQSIFGYALYDGGKGPNGATNVPFQKYQTNDQPYN